MNNCKTCNAEIPAGMIGCPACATRTSVRDFRKLQTNYLTRIEKGDVQLGLVRLHGEWHVQMIGTDMMAWCGRDTSGPSRRMRATYDALPMTGVCDECVRAIQEALREAHA